MLLPEKYESIFDVSSEGPSSGSLVNIVHFVSVHITCQKRFTLKIVIKLFQRRFTFYSQDWPHVCIDLLIDNNHNILSGDLVRKYLMKIGKNVSIDALYLFGYIAKCSFKEIFNFSNSHLTGTQFESKVVHRCNWMLHVFPR